MKFFLLITMIGIALLAFAGYSYTQEQKFLARAAARARNFCSCV
jgi:hypothetical protein